MNFGEQIKKLRKQKNLTQEQMASQLGISRQAVSNWENDRNLPDIEMLISIAVTFQISLDDLILGGRDMNNMTEKLIKDGSENRRAKMNLISTCIGAGLLLGGVACFIAKALTPVTLNADGFLQESFFSAAGRSAADVCRLSGFCSNRIPQYLVLHTTGRTQRRIRGKT